MAADRNRPVELAITILFLAAVCTPFLLWMVQKSVHYSEAEKRELQPLPTLSAQASVRDFFKNFDRYFQDHFGLREWLIHRYQRETSKRFGKSGSPLVVDGRQGWLFYAGDQILDDLKGRQHLDPEQEQEFWHLLELKKQWLKKRGIGYIFLVPPNKQSIYPEYLPRHYRQLKKQTRLEHLLNNPAVDTTTLLDVRGALEKEKNRVRLYDKSDTHWNYQGALVASRELLARVGELFPDFVARTEFPFRPDWEKGPGGDLALMSGRIESIGEKRPMLERKDYRARVVPVSKELMELLNLPQLQPVFTINPSGSLRVLILHDSFFNVMSPFFGENFREAFYVWQYYDAKTLEFFNNREHLERLLDMYRPDLVIEECLERFLPRFIDSNRWLETGVEQAEGKR